LIISVAEFRYNNANAIAADVKVGLACGAHVSIPGEAVGIESGDVDAEIEKDYKA
jgi:hypothetical protein